jgi:ribose transport system ATP-binding protein
MTTAKTSPPLAIKNLSKAFQGQWALRGVDLELRAGEVHALVGQNGSGKSTLIKILAGYHQPEPGGEATCFGEPFHLGSSDAAREANLHFIHQDLAIIDQLSVAENLALGQRYGLKFWLSPRRERKAAQALFASYGLPIDAGVPLRTLGAAQRTMTAMVRALGHADSPTGILVLDEPTASLSDEESQRLFELVRSVRDKGGSVLYVTHRLHEVFDLADRVTVLRDGRRVATEPVSRLDHDALVELIIGRRLEEFYPEPPAARDDSALTAKGVSGRVARDVSLTVHAGEIVGISGLTGSGVEEILHLMFGSSPRTSGTVEVGDGTTVGASPSQSVRAGVAFSPADRQRLGGMGAWSLRENLTLPRLLPRGPLRWLSPRRERAEATEWLQRFDVVPTNAEATFSSLSGGNQQKVVIARWLRRGAGVYFFEEPTAGVDVGAKRAIYEALSRVAADGAGVLVASCDAEEIASICDRVLVMRSGRIAKELSGDALTPDRVLAYSVGSGDPVRHQGPGGRA